MLSIIFSPLFVPVYAYITALSVTQLHMVAASTRAVTTLVVASLVSIVPLVVLLIMKAAGRISDIDISNRRQRTLPMLLIFVCYILAAVYIRAIHAPAWLVLYFISGIVSVIVLGLITVLVKWKISMHGAGAGNLIGMFVAMQRLGVAEHSMLGLITAAILVAGMVGSARIVLRKHTLTQVFAGTTVSALITYFMMMLAAGITPAASM
ncbi:MAG: hypothetical protein PUE10_06065 [Bacteroidales bacterium]|nr:hypothetical protein [Bacteroidales bacterium]